MALLFVACHCFQTTDNKVIKSCPVPPGEGTPDSSGERREEVNAPVTGREEREITTDRKGGCEGRRWSDKCSNKKREREQEER